MKFYYVFLKVRLTKCLKGCTGFSEIDVLRRRALHGALHARRAPIHRFTTIAKSEPHHARRMFGEKCHTSVQNAPKMGPKIYPKIITPGTQHQPQVPPRPLPDLENEPPGLQNDPPDLKNEPLDPRKSGKIAMVTPLQKTFF